MTYRLNKGYVLVRVDQPKEKNDSGVFITEEWQLKPPTGVVEAVAGVNTQFVKVGDHVFFERYGAIQSPFDKDLKICREDAIFMVYDV